MIGQLAILKPHFSTGPSLFCFCGRAAAIVLLCAFGLASCSNGNADSLPTEVRDGASEGREPREGREGRSSGLDTRHVFYGAINRSGKAVGYHHRAGGKDPETARVTRIVDPPNARGIYRARVEIYDSRTRRWVAKGATSTFFPDAWSREKVVEEIEGAFARKTQPKRDVPAYWEGVSPSGVRIGGYSKGPGKISTAFPIN